MSLEASRADTPERKLKLKPKFFANNKSKHIHTRISLGKINKHD